jgi:AcrR family transcriptional regulator
MARTALGQDEITAFRKKATVAAMRLFAEQGYEAVTMRSLAAALGVSAMTPYRYLAGKEELFAMVRAEAFRRFADRLEESQKRKGDPLARLRRLKKAYIGFAVDEPDAYRTMFELRQPDPAAYPELEAESKRSFGHLHTCVAEAVAAGALRGDALTVATLLWANTHGLVSLHLAGRIDAPTLSRLASVEHELAGFKPTPSPSEEEKS